MAAGEGGGQIMNSRKPTQKALESFVIRNKINSKAAIADESYYVPGEWSSQRKASHAKASSRSYYKCLWFRLPAISFSHFCPLRNHEEQKAKAATRMRELRAKRKGHSVATQVNVEATQQKKKRRKKKNQPHWLPEQARAERDMLLSDDDLEDVDVDEEVSASSTDYNKIQAKGVNDQGSTLSPNVTSATGQMHKSLSQVEAWAQSSSEDELSDFEFESAPLSSPHQVPHDADFSGSESDTDNNVETQPESSTAEGPRLESIPPTESPPKPSRQKKKLPTATLVGWGNLPPERVTTLYNDINWCGCMTPVTNIFDFSDGNVPSPALSPNTTAKLTGLTKQSSTEPAWSSTQPSSAMQLSDEHSQLVLDYSTDSTRLRHTWVESALFRVFRRFGCCCSATKGTHTVEDVVQRVERALVVTEPPLCVPPPKRALGRCVGRGLAELGAEVLTWRARAQDRWRQAWLQRDWRRQAGAGSEATGAVAAGSEATGAVAAGVDTAGAEEAGTEEAGADVGREDAGRRRRSGGGRQAWTQQARRRQAWMQQVRTRRRQAGVDAAGAEEAGVDTAEEAGADAAGVDEYTQVKPRLIWPGLYAELYTDRPCLISNICPGPVSSSASGGTCPCGGGRRRGGRQAWTQQAQRRQAWTRQAWRRQAWRGSRRGGSRRGGSTGGSRRGGGAEEAARRRRQQRGEAGAEEAAAGAGGRQEAASVEEAAREAARRRQQAEAGRGRRRRQPAGAEEAAEEAAAWRRQPAGAEAGAEGGRRRGQQAEEAAGGGGGRRGGRRDAAGAEEAARRGRSQAWRRRRGGAAGGAETAGVETAGIETAGTETAAQSCRRRRTSAPSALRLSTISRHASRAAVVLAGRLSSQTSPTPELGEVEPVFLQELQAMSERKNDRGILYTCRRNRAFRGLQRTLNLRGPLARTGVLAAAHGDGVAVAADGFLNLARTVRSVMGLNSRIQAQGIGHELRLEPAAMPVGRQHLKPSALHGLDAQSLILHTSGTTGKKKVAPTSCAPSSSALPPSSTPGTSSREPADVNLNMMPLFHVGGIVRNLLAPVFSGGSTVMCAGFDTIVFWTLARDLQASWCATASLMNTNEWKPVGITRRRRSTTRFCHHSPRASSPPRPAHPHDRKRRGRPAAVARVSLKATFGAVILPSYGMTECMPIASPPITYQLERPGCSGLACSPHLSVRVQREPGNFEFGLPQCSFTVPRVPESLT
ncbi:hypothetical protein B0H10DRAFT_1939287 [Mycena sp. CBHHK59/15]|nr:hypothetical protein B0H10DRAFT_1939287 [Mycena sp. CBHHK59/15]